MKKRFTLRGFSAYQLLTQLPRIEVSRLPDVIMFGAGIALVYGVVTVGHSWFGPFTPTVEISSSLRALPAYAGYSLLRITIAYVLSLGFALVYGYVAAYNPRAERFMLPLLDVLQSIPVLSFLPGVMLAMVALFPGRQLGVELGAILLIFTGQVWNMAFSFYASLKSIPKDMREAAEIYRFSWWQRFTEMELPFSAIGLVWNSMMSVAGGWFALMVCEMFVLGSRDFRLPGLGSYLQTAASAGDTSSICWGIATMVLVIVLLDQFVWRPVIAWAEKFKVEQVESTDAPRSWVLNLVERSNGLARIREKTLRPLGERLLLYFAQKHREEHPAENPSPWRDWLLRGLAVALMKIANDMRWLASGPRTGFAELLLPQNEPGSSIMPGKVNPTQCEAIVMIAIQVLGDDTAVAFAGSQGNFELNAMRPLIISNFLHSARILADGMEKFRTFSVAGTELNRDKIAQYVDESLMLVTALSPVIGYQSAACIAEAALANGQTLKQAALASGYVDEKTFDSVVDPAAMVGHGVSGA